jgi:glycine cleavage system aminomethyltransferase T
MKILNLDTGKNINLKFNVNVWVQRLSYVGELGYELYVQKDKDAKEIYDLIINYW